MKRLLHPLTVTSIAAAVLLFTNNAVGNEQTLDPAEDNVENEPMLLAQNAAPNNPRVGQRSTKRWSARDCRAVQRQEKHTKDYHRTRKWQLPRNPPTSLC